MPEDLPRYKCHKEVRALKIKSITPKQNGAILHFDNWPTIHVSGEYYRKHTPKPGGYYVLYDDGYESWSPADAFEAGYTPL